MSWLFCSDLSSWNLSDPSDFSAKLFRHKIHVFHSCSVGLTSFHPLPPTSILQTVCSNKTLGKDLFLSKPSLKDWDWFSVGMWGGGSQARPVCGDCSGVSMSGRVTTSLLSPLSVQVFMFRMLRITNNNCLDHFCVAVWNFPPVSLVTHLLHFYLYAPFQGQPVDERDASSTWFLL